MSAQPQNGLLLAMLLAALIPWRCDIVVANPLLLVAKVVGSTWAKRSEMSAYLSWLGTEADNGLTP